MWAAQIAPGHVNRTTYHDSEQEALRWLEREMRAAGTKHGVTYKVAVSAFEAPLGAEESATGYGENDGDLRPSDRRNGEAA